MATLPADPEGVDNPTTGQPIPAAWGDAVDYFLEFLAGMPACSVFQASGSPQSVNDNTATIVTAASEGYDTDGMHSTVSQTSRITVKTAGTFLLFASVNFAADADGYRDLSIFKNGSLFYELMRVPSAGASVATVLTGTMSTTAAVNDYFEVDVKHTAGAALNVVLQEFAMRMVAFTPT